MMRMLQQQTTDLRAHVQLLQAQIETQNFTRVHYHVCSWEHVKPHMCLIPKRMLLGLDLERCRMKPSEEHIKKEILDIFDVSSNDREQPKAFDKAWVREIKKKVLMTFNNRQGRFSTSALSELGRILEVPNPINASQHEMQEWMHSLRVFENGNIFFAKFYKFLILFENKYFVFIQF